MQNKITNPLYRFTGLVLSISFSQTGLANPIDPSSPNTSTITYHNGAAVSTDINNSHHYLIQPDSYQNGTISVNSQLTSADGANAFFHLQSLNIAAPDTATLMGVFYNGHMITNDIVWIDNAANIWGRLNTETSNGGGPNVYIFDPNGINLYNGSHVDIAGSFFMSNASNIMLGHYTDSGNTANGQRVIDGCYGVDCNSNLNASTPVAFGFLGNERGNLTLHGATLDQFKEDVQIGLVGENNGPGPAVDIQGTTISIANGGFQGIVNGQPYSDGVNIRILGLKSTDNLPTINVADNLPNVLGEKYVPINMTPMLEADATVNNLTLSGGINIVNSVINAGGDGEENTIIKGGDVVINNSTLLATNWGSDSAGCEENDCSHIQNENDGNITSDFDEYSSAFETAITPNYVGIQITSSHDLQLTSANLFGFSAYGQAGSIQLQASNAIGIDHSNIYTSLANASWTQSNVAFNYASIVNANGTFNLQNPSADLSASAYVTTANSASAQANAGDINITAGNSLNITNHSYLSSSTYVNSNAPNNGNAGQITLSSASLAIGNNSLVNTDTFNNGNAGKIVIGQGDQAAGANRATDIYAGSIVSSSTSGSGNAGSIEINTGNLQIQGAGPISVHNLGKYDPSLTGLQSAAKSEASGNAQAGGITINDSGDAILANGAQISTSNHNTAANQSLPDGHLANIVFNAKNISMTNSQIVSDASGRFDAGKINITLDGGNFYIDPSAISTSSAISNGGDINILGTNQIWLFNSGILTSVGSAGTAIPAGLNGGNISIGANFLIMENGFIEANSFSTGGAGGLVNINIENIIPSGGTVILGGTTAYGFQPYAGFNVIQAAAPDGVNGAVNITSPQLNLSGALANLVIPKLDQNAFTQDMCAIGEANSLTQVGRGALPRRANDKLISPPAKIE